MSAIRAVLADPEKLNKIKLYEDDICVAVLSTKPVSICHIIVIPKKQYTIVEQIPDNEVEHLFVICNKMSQALFESLNIQGTNIYVQNGIPAGQEDPQCTFNIVARTEKDGVLLEWEPKTLSEDDMGTAEAAYKSVTGNTVFNSEGSSAEIVAKEKPSEEVYDDDDEEEENYLVKYFDRSGP